MRPKKPNENLSLSQRLPGAEKGEVQSRRNSQFSGLLTFSRKIGSTCDLGTQGIELAPGASSTCGNGACSCCSCCSW
jgi:hypothetical protein